MFGISNCTFEFFRQKLENIDDRLIDIRNKINYMEELIMTQKEDLDAALGTLQTTLDTAVQDIKDAFKRLEDKITAGSTGPDLAAEIAQVNAAVTKLGDIDLTAKGEAAS